MAADLLNDRLIPLFEDHEILLLRILTVRGTEYCGNLEHLDYQLSLTMEGIEDSTTKARSSQSNGIDERFQRTMNEFYQPVFRTKVYTSKDQLQEGVDHWVREYKGVRPHSRKYCYGKPLCRRFSIPYHMPQKNFLVMLNRLNKIRKNVRLNLDSYR